MWNSTRPNTVHIGVLTLFPDLVCPYLQTSILKRAQDKGKVQFQILSIRDFGIGHYHSVDASPFGGGPGMVLRVDVLYRAWEKIWQLMPKMGKTIVLSPQGKTVTQGKIQAWSRQQQCFVFVCGHYEGIDARFLELTEAEEVSVGDFILTGGELPALMMIDALVRGISGVLGNQKSSQEDSFSDACDGLLKHPLYTRPSSYQGLEVPQVLRSGHHQAMDQWRKQQRRVQTQKKRPDLWKTFLEKQKENEKK